MDAEATGARSPDEILALVLAAVAELEAEGLAARRASRAPHAADVVARLEAAGVPLSPDRVAEALRVAVKERGLATGVLTSGGDGVPDVRSLHVTMAGVRWLRSQVQSEDSPSGLPSPLGLHP